MEDIKIEYNIDNDYLLFHRDKEIRKIINNEIILYSDAIIKINRHGQAQERSLIITNLALYNLKKKELKRRVEIKNIKGISCSSESKELVIHCVENEYDYHYESSRRNKIIQIINAAYKDSHKLEIDLCVVNSKSLAEFVTLKTEKKKDMRFSRMPQNGKITVKNYLDNIQAKKSSVYNIGNIFNLYDFKKICLIGKGSYSKVYLVEHEPTNNEFAMKVISKDLAIDQGKEENIINEQEILSNEKNGFILNSIQIFNTKKKDYILYPYLPGGDLYFHLVNGPFDEERVRFYSAQVLFALNFLHSKGYVYRDLKPENIGIDENGYIKLLDFGLARKIKNKTFSFCGSPEYISPEIILGHGHEKTTDFWSLGILIFELLFQCVPFFDENTPRMYEKICYGNLQFPRNSINVSNDAIDLITKLLYKIPSERLGAGGGYEEIKKHPFFNNINFDMIISRRIIPSFLPNISGRFTTEYVNPEYRKETNLNDSIIDDECLRLLG